MSNQDMSARGGKNVTIYSTPTCHFCHMAKEFFNENAIEYTDYDVSKDVAKREEMLKRSGQMGVPVIYIEDEMVIGFNKPELERLLEIK